MMSLFWQGYGFFLANFVAILVCGSSAGIFYLVVLYEKKILGMWRAIGFSSLAVAFFLFILAEKFSSVELTGVFFELFGFFAIYRGVLSEPKLSQLLKPVVGGKRGSFLNQVVGMVFDKNTRTVIFSLLFFGGVAAITHRIIGPYTMSFFSLVALVFIAASMPVQFKRLITSNAVERVHNFFPLLAYAFLLVREVCLVFYRLPGNISIVWLQQMTLEYHLVWQLSIIATFVGFALLMAWIWSFIAVRSFTRTMVVFLALVLLMSSMSALLSTSLIFSTVQTDNLNLLGKGADSVKLIMEDRAVMSSALTSTLSSDPNYIQLFVKGGQSFQDYNKRFQTNATIDFFRVYTKDGKIVDSPSDPRDIGRLFNTDTVLMTVAESGKPITAYSTIPGVLAPTVIAHSIYPILSSGGSTIGMIDLGFTFDNAFTDFAKSKTGLDVTILSDFIRSATTLTQDGISRWVGSKETDSNVISTVSTKSQSYQGEVALFSQASYAAYVPINDVNGKFLGAVSASEPTATLFNALRGQILSMYLYIIALSLLAAGMGYFILKKVGGLGRTER